MKTSSMLGYVHCAGLNQTGSDHIGLFPITVVTGIFFFSSGNIGLNKVYSHIININLTNKYREHKSNMVKLCNLYGKIVPIW